MWAMLMAAPGGKIAQVRVYGIYPSFLVKPFGSVRVYGLYPSFLVR